jgi:hypothetical protein
MKKIGSSKTQNICLLVGVGLLCLIILCALAFSNGEEVKAEATEFPEIVLSTADWTQAVTVTINYPESVTYRKYQTVWKQIPPYSIKDYEGPFVIDDEGETEIRAYYEAGQYIAQSITNIDKTKPTDLRASLQVNLRDQEKILLKVNTSDLHSGIKKVWLYGLEHVLENINGEYVVDFTNKAVGKSFTIVAEDNAGNQNTLSFTYSVFDYITEIRYLATLYESLDNGSQYTTKLWGEIEDTFSQLEMAFTVPYIDSSEVTSLEDRLMRQLEGQLKFSTEIKEILIGMDSIIRYGISEYALDAKKGSDIILSISNATFTEDKKSEYDLLLTTLSGYSSVKTIPIKLELKERDGEYINITGEMNIEFVKPKRYENVKLFYFNEQGTFREILTNERKGNINAKVNSDGIFFVVLDEETSQDSMFKNGYVINGKFYSYGLFWGVIAGGVALSVVVFFITYSLVSKRGRPKRLSRRLTRR